MAPRQAGPSRNPSTVNLPMPIAADERRLGRRLTRQVRFGTSSRRRNYGYVLDYVRAEWAVPFGTRSCSVFCASPPS